MRSVCLAAVLLLGACTSTVSTHTQTCLAYEPTITSLAVMEPKLSKEQWEQVLFYAPVWRAACENPNDLASQKTLEDAAWKLIQIERSVK